MESCILENIDEFKKVANNWDEALLLSREDNPFLLSDFLITWWQYHSEGRKLRIFLIREGNTVVAGLPLCLEKGFLRNNLVHIGGCWANLTQFFTTDTKINIPALLLDSLKGRDDWDNLILNRVLSAHAFSRQIESIPWVNFEDFGYIVEEEGLQGLIDLSPGYERIIAGLNQRLKRYLRNCKEQAARIGELKLIKVEGKSNLKALFRDFRNFSIRRFRQRKNVSMLEDKQESDFFSDLIGNFDGQARLDAYKFNAGETTLGISFGYRFGRGFKWILATYNPDFSNLRPGHLMLDLLIREAIKRGDPYFDMYYGGELFYKQQWCNKIIPLLKIVVFRKGLLNQALLNFDRRLRSSRVILNAARSLKRRLRIYRLR